MGTAADRKADRRLAGGEWPTWTGCALALILCVVALHTIRLDYGPDEPDHLQYIHMIAREFRLPTPTETHSVQHPPLYFALMAVPYRLGGSDIAPLSVPAGPERLHVMTAPERRSRYLCRYLQVLLTVATVWLIGAVLRQVLWGRPRLRALTLIGLACWPLLSWGGAVVNNDMLVTLWSAVLVWWGLRLVQGQNSANSTGALLGLLLGVGLWMKLTIVYCAPALVALVWWHQRAWKARLGFLLIFAVVTVVIGCWWYVRCAVLFGDPFPNFAGQMGGEARIQALLRHDPLGGGLRFLMTAVRDLARACLLPEFLWPVWQGGAGHLSLAVVQALVLLTVVAYLVEALAPLRQRVELRLSVVGPAALALCCACIMVIYYAVTKDLRAITSGGRYMFTSAVWGAILGAGVAERLALVVVSPSVRCVLMLGALGASLGLALLFQWLLGAWYGAIP